MSDENALVPMTASGPLAPSDVVRQVALVQEVMGAVMKDGEHYGKIPGCGDKPTLLQPGAQVLAFTFRLAPRFKVDERTLEHGHREFYVECELYSIQTGVLVGMGVGMASTMESKWRFRTGPVEFTGLAVPGKYWALRKETPAEALELIGGRGHATKKNPDTGAWEIVKAGDKVENDNPADIYNTALKIATKRSFVHAVLNATAASDMFTQDLEDLPNEIHAEPAVVAEEETQPEQQKVAPKTAGTNPDFEAYKALKAIADLKDTWESVKAALGHPETPEAAFAAYKAMGQKMRDTLEVIAKDEVEEEIPS